MTKQEEFDYAVFVLGYDLLQKDFAESDKPECDIVHGKCVSIAKKFYDAEFSINNTFVKYCEQNKSLYDCLVDFTSNEAVDIESFINDEYEPEKDQEIEKD